MHHSPKSCAPALCTHSRKFFPGLRTGHNPLPPRNLQPIPADSRYSRYSRMPPDSLPDLSATRAYPIDFSATHFRPISFAASDFGQNVEYASMHGNAPDPRPLSPDPRPSRPRTPALHIRAKVFSDRTNHPNSQPPNTLRPQFRSPPLCTLFTLFMTAPVPSRPSPPRPTSRYSQLPMKLLYRCAYPAPYSPPAPRNSKNLRRGYGGCVLARRQRPSPRGIDARPVETLGVRLNGRFSTQLQRLVHP
jgi:hypothetical protein